MPLTDTACRNAKPAEKPRKLSDGGGLFLHVSVSGGKSWRMAYRYDGKLPLSPCASPSSPLSARRNFVRPAGKSSKGLTRMTGAHRSGASPRPG